MCDRMFPNPHEFNAAEKINLNRYLVEEILAVEAAYEETYDAATVIAWSFDALKIALRAGHTRDTLMTADEWASLFSDEMDPIHLY